SPLTCSADGTLVAVNDGGKVRLWQREAWSMREITPPEVPHRPIVWLAFSPAGAWLATLDHAGELCVTHLPTGNWVRRVKGVTGKIIAFSPEGRHVLISGSGLAVVRLWSADNSEDALQSAAEALARNSNDADALEQRARVALRRGRHKEALAD